jgi:CubicO group peptidase (beta-lactamase class C family)
MDKQNSMLTRLMCLVTLVSLVQTLTGLPYAVQAQEARTISLTDPKEFEAFLDPIFAEQMKKMHIPGAAIAVVKDGKIFFSKGYGYANLETKTPVTADKTIFRIGSITKVFTATSLVQLAERRKINLNDDVNKYLKDFKIQNTYPQPVTFANLLTHTAGFDEINLGRKTTSEDRVIPLGEFLKARLIRRKPPGDFISYSTYGISLAGHLVETISGTPYKVYLNKNIFQPLGMNRTSIVSVSANLQPDFATGYDYSADSYRPLGFEYFHTYPASDINSTAIDMARFMLAHLEGGRYGTGRILSERAARNMHEQHFTNHPRLLGIAYGFFENRQNGLRAIEHGGSMEGFSALLYLSPEKRLGIFIAANRETGDLQEEVRSKILDRYFPTASGTKITQPPAGLKERLDRFAGKYRADFYCHTCKEGARGYVPQAFDIKANDDGTISLWGGQWRQIEPLLFQLVRGQLGNGETLVAFQEDQTGQIVRMFNGTWTHEKLPPETTEQTVTVNISPQILNAYVGQYEIAPNLLVTITLEGDKLMGVMTGQSKVELAPASETRFVVREANAEVNFFKDAQGRVTHLILRLNGEEMRGRKIK